MRNTQDLGKFGHVEKQVASQLLGALNTELDHTKFFGESGVSVEFNPQSGMVFLVDEDCNTAVMEDDNLVDFRSCPDCGNEGTTSDLEVQTLDDCCQEYFVIEGE